MPKIKCELEVSHEQLDEIRSTIEKFAPKVEVQLRADINRNAEIALLNEALSCMALNWQVGDCVHARQCVTDCIAQLQAAVNQWNLEEPKCD